MAAAETHVRTPRARYAASAACLFVAAPVLPAAPWFSLVVAAGLVVCGVVAVRSRSAPAVRVTAVAAAVAVVFHATILLEWPPTVRIVLAIAAIAGVTLGFRQLTPAGMAFDWLRPGRISWLLAGAVVLVVVGTTAALVIWARLTDPVLPGYIVGFRDSPLWQVALAVTAFSLVNAALEESLFRGVLLDEVSATWAPGPALAVQAVAFGLFHLNGFPSGWAGMVMAGVWGYLLGLLRVHGRGIVLPYVAHVGADATIAVISTAMLT
ncbi:hypothetical protein GCM10029964_081900 [Kibdelosporangium lantanae]